MSKIKIILEKINIKKYLRDKSAVTSVEYALIVCLAALGIIISLGFAGKGVRKVFKEIGKILKHSKTRK